MNSRWIRAAGLLAVSAALGSAPAHAFDTVDALPWPSAGAFLPAYERDATYPWGFSAYAGTMYDTNAQRRPDETADWISRIGIAGRYAARVYGRQSITLDGFGEYRKFDELSQYDHFAYGLRGRWLWELGNQLSGIATVSRTHRLVDIAEITGTGTGSPMVTADRLDVGGGYRFHPDWRLTGGAGTGRVVNEGRVTETTHSYGARAGLEYVSPLGNAIGVEARHTQGDAPVEVAGLSLLGNDYEENEVALTLAYALGATLRVRGRLGQTERSYTEVGEANFTGTTGRAAIEWRPGIKTVLTFEGYREPQPVIDVDALYIDVRGIALGYAWAMTYKLVFSARYLSERRLFKGDVLAAASGAPPRDENVSVIRLGLGWEPERRWQFGSSLDFGRRTSNAIGRDYNYTAVTVNLRYTF